MVVQLPDEALAAAVGVLIYSVLCLLCSSLVILLVWKHHEKGGYVALLGYFTSLGTAASIAQELHTIVLWRDVKTEQYDYIRHNFGCAVISLAGPSTGVDLILFYIQFYCYNVVALIAVIWAFALAHSVFHALLPERWQQIRGGCISLLAKIIAILQPLLLVSFLQLRVIQQSPFGFLVLADVTLVISIILVTLIIIAMLAKHIYTRRRLHRWSFRHRATHTLDTERGLEATSDDHGEDHSEAQNTTYDIWLILRFTIAFLFLVAFQILDILSEFGHTQHSKPESFEKTPDLSSARANRDFPMFIPGVSPSLLVFIVFGTSQSFRRTLYVSLIPRRFRKGTTITREEPGSPSSPGTRQITILRPRSAPQLIYPAPTLSSFRLMRNEMRASLDFHEEVVPRTLRLIKYPELAFAEKTIRNEDNSSISTSKIRYSGAETSGSGEQTS